MRVGSIPAWWLLYFSDSQIVALDREICYYVSAIYKAMRIKRETFSVSLFYSELAQC